MPVKIERKTDWRLTEAQSDEKEEIKSYFKQNIWKNKNADILYQWKYEENPAGNTTVFSGKNSSESIIAGAFFMPWALSLRNRPLRAVQWVDMFVDLEYRGENIGAKMLGCFRSSQYSICFAFPNHNGVMVHKKNGGIHLGNIIRYTKPINIEYIAKRWMRPLFLVKIASFFLNLFLRLISKETYYINLYGYSLEKIKNCTAEFDALWNRLSLKFNDKIITAKNSAYLNWKYANSPNKNRFIYALRKNNSLDGFVVLESSAEIGYIVDILAVSKSALYSLIAYAIRYFRKLGKTSIVFVALENNIYFLTLKRFGFVERPDIKHFYIYLNENVEGKSYIFDSQNWFITIGDCDIEAL